MDATVNTTSKILPRGNLTEMDTIKACTQRRNERRKADRKTDIQSDIIFE